MKFGYGNFINQSAKVFLFFLACESILGTTNSLVPVAKPTQRIMPLEVVSKPPQDEERNSIELLQGKLHILEAVIHEIQGREKETAETASALQMKQRKTIERLENELQNSKARENKQKEKMESINSQSYQLVENIEAKCREKDLEIETYRGEIKSLKDEIAENNDCIQLLKEKSETLKSDFEDQKRNDLLQMESSLEERAREYEKNISSLQKELETLSEAQNDYDERTEIATAAANAAEQRAEVASTKYTEAEKLLKQAQFQIKVQQLTLESLIDENLTFEKSNRELKHLVLANEEVVEAQQRYNVKRVLVRLRSWFSKK